MWSKNKVTYIYDTTLHGKQQRATGLHQDTVKTMLLWNELEENDDLKQLLGVEQII